MKIKELISKGLLKIKLEWSYDTWEHYKGHAEHFLKWATYNEFEDVEDITETVLIDYISDMKQTCTGRTLNMRIGNLKRLYKHADVDTTIFNNISKFKEVKKTYEMVEIKEIKRIREYLYNYEQNLTHKAIMLLLMETGCRRRELTMMEKKNVDIERRIILLSDTKTKEQREVPFKERTIPVIMELLSLDTNHKYLIHNVDKNKPITREVVDHVVGRKYRNLMSTNLHAHMFRHSLVSLMLEAGAQREVVKEITGIKNDSVLARYTHIKKSHVAKSYDEKFKLD